MFFKFFFINIHFFGGRGMPNHPKDWTRTLIYLIHSLRIDHSRHSSSPAQSWKQYLC